MKIIFPIFFLSLFFAANANASEILGTISTNPNQNSLDNQSSQSSSGSSVVIKPTIVPAVKVATGSKELIGQETVEPIIKTQPIAETGKTSVKNILGIKIYPDGALLRGADHRIYLIHGQTKKYIIDLSELKKYRGREIIFASAEELAYYNDRAHANGELIRQRGDVKVYVIANGTKKHILDLQELRAHYAGLEIFNIEPEEMALY
jgi:hypothetical protein